MNLNTHEQKIQKQFGFRVPTYNTAANWMQDPTLLDLHLQVLGAPTSGRDQCLELCCGTGIVGKALIEKGWKVDGIDITPEMVKVANDFFPSIVGSVERMPYENATFDAAIIRQAYMLLDGPRALKEIRRTLKTGGVFVLGQSVNFGDADNETYQQVQEARHINMTRYYKTADLIEELENHGFTVESEKTTVVRESVDQWLGRAPELSPELRGKIRNLIAHAPESYKKARQVEMQGGELFENWKWVVLKARAT